jgi:hypothetical protein
VSAGRGRHRAPAVTLTLTLHLVLFAGVAGAVTPEAEALFRDGRRLMAEGNVAQACAAFAQSYAADASSGTLLNLALCHEKQGKTATALAEYTATVRLAEAQGRQDRVLIARQKIAAMEPRLARLTVAVPRAVPGLAIQTEAGAIAGADWGRAVPVDPGPHHITASAPGFRSWTADIELREAEQRTIDIPALEPAVDVTAPRTSATATAAAATPPQPPPVALTATATAAPRSSRDLYLMGAGGALVIAGSVLYGVAYAKFEDAKQVCNEGAGCSPSERNERVSSIETFRNWGIGCWIAGGVLTVASGMHRWYSRRPPPVTVAIDPWNETFSVRAVF